MLVRVILYVAPFPSMQSSAAVPGAHQLRARPAKLALWVRIMLAAEFFPTVNRPRGYKTVFVLTQLSINFFLLISVKMPTIVGILTFMSRKNNILGLSEPKKS